MVQVYENVKKNNSDVQRLQQSHRSLVLSLHSLADVTPVNRRQFLTSFHATKTPPSGLDTFS
jgi:hypothetical protein